MSAAKLAALHGWRRDASLTFVVRAGKSVTLRDQAGKLVEVDFQLYRDLIAEGFATKPDSSNVIDFIPDEYGRRKQEMKLAAIRRDAELRANGNSAARAFEILKGELLEDARHASYAPSSFNIRTLQMWKKTLGDEGPNRLIPHNQDQGQFGPRHDADYEDCVFEVLEQLLLKSDRVTIRVAAAKAEKLYRDRYTGTKEKLGDCALRSFLSVMNTLRADDVIRARHDTETAKRLTLQARFYARVEVPFDVVEIDSTVGDVFLSDIRGVCIGRPVICAAIDAASGFPLAIRIDLESASEKLTIQTIKEIMLPRGEEFFERLGIENRINTAGVPRVLVSDQGSENSGKWLPGIIAQSGMEWAKNIPGCPEKKPHVERFFLELNRYLQTLPGATTSKTMPHRARIEKGMFEACITVEELEGLIYKWIYDVYATKIRRLIHSPLRVAESPLDSWNRMVNGIAQLPLQPNEVHQIFMVKETKRSLQHYGLDVGNVQYSSPELCELLSEIGRKSTVEVRYDPTDIRAIAVVHNRDGVPNPMIVPAKSEHVLPIAFKDVARIKKPSDEAKAKDLAARATAADLAQKAQELAEQRGKGKITSLRKARKAEAQRRKITQVVERAKSPPLKSASVSKTVNQPTPRMAVRRREQRPQMDILE